MTDTRFSEMMRDLATFYERKHPRDEAIELWYKRVKNIPDECVPWITDRIMEDNEMFPRNIASLCWALYHEWLRAHPEKYASKQYYDCKYCLEGIIYVWKERKEDGKTGLPVSFLFRCGHCKQVDMKSWPMSRMEELLAEGYFVRRGKRMVGGAQTSVSQMIAGIGKTIPKQEQEGGLIDG